MKWPNDLLCQGRKLAGILIEMASEGQQVKHLVVGIGVNVNQRSFDDPLRAIATSLSLQRGRAVGRAQVLVQLLWQLEQQIERLIAGDTAQLLREWEGLAPWIGQKVAVRGIDESVEGTARGVSPSGALLLLDDDTGQVKEVMAGDLHLGC